jgi:hypothetical protein
MLNYVENYVIIFNILMELIFSKHDSLFFIKNKTFLHNVDSYFSCFFHFIVVHFDELYFL